MKHTESTQKKMSCGEWNIHNQSDDDFMTREKGEMLKTGYLEVVHAATVGVIPLNEDEEHGVDPEENFLWGMQHS